MDFTWINTKLTQLNTAFKITSFEILDNVPAEIISDLKHAITIEPDKGITKVKPFAEQLLYEKDKKMLYNAYMKLIFDYYLASFDVTTASTQEISEVLTSYKRIIDVLHAKGISAVNLMPVKLLELNISGLYYKLRTFDDAPLFIELVQQLKHNTYSMLLSYLLSKRLYLHAEELYLENAFYITSTYFVEYAAYYLSDIVSELPKQFCDLILNENRKIALNDYTQQLKLKEFAALYTAAPDDFMSNPEVDAYFTSQADYTYINLILHFDHLLQKLFTDAAEKTQKLMLAPEMSLYTTFATLFPALQEKKIERLENKIALSMFYELERLYGKQLPLEDRIDGLSVLCSRNTNEVTPENQIIATQSLNMFGSDLQIFLDSFVQVVDIQLRINESKSNDYLNSVTKLSNETRYFLTEIFDFYVNVRNHSVERLDGEMVHNFIEKVTNRTEELLEEMVNSLVANNLKNLSSETIKEYCYDFFMANEYKNNTLDAAEVERLLRKAEKSPATLQVLATGELLSKPYKNIEDDIMSGDFTALVTCQIKSVERYLKDAIIEHVRTFGNKNIMISGSTYEIELVDKPATRSQRRNRNFLEVDHTTTPEKLGASMKSCREFILQNMSLEGEGQRLFTGGGENSLQREWVSPVRNNYFHAGVIETLGKAKEVLAETAFWFLQIIDELDEIR